MAEEVSTKVKKIVADHLGIDEAKVTDESSFIDDLGADSLDTVELVMAFEEEFGSEISDSEAEKILTVGDAIKFIENKSPVSIVVYFCQESNKIKRQILMPNKNKVKDASEYVNAIVENRRVEFLN